jgi:hypothetical protein
MKKLKAFFRSARKKVCQEQNVNNLMLDEEVVEATRQGLFHIWEVGHIAEGIELLTGVQAGNIRAEDGQFPPESIFSKVEERFDKMYKEAQNAKKRVPEKVPQ